MALRRAYADEYAVRVNRAAVLLRERSPADAVRALQAEFGLSERGSDHKFAWDNAKR